MEERLIFTLDSFDGVVHIENRDLENLGYLEKRRIGAWMTWCLFLNEDCYMTAGCLDEIRAKIKELNATANKKASHNSDNLQLNTTGIKPNTK